MKRLLTALPLILLLTSPALIANPGHSARALRKQLQEADLLADLLVKGKYTPYIDALKKRLIQANSCKTRAYIHNELADVYTRRLLNAELAAKHNAKLSEILASCKFSETPDGYCHLPKFIPASKGKPFLVKYEAYLDLYRNLSKEELKAHADGRKENIAVLLGKEKLFDLSPLNKQASEVGSLEKSVGNKFIPISKQVRAGVALAGHYAALQEWKKALKMAAWSVQMAGAQKEFSVLDDLERLRCYFILYKGLYHIGAYEDSVKYLRGCISLLEKVRQRYGTEKQRALFFNQLEELIGLKLSFFLERKQLPQALASLDERKSRTLKELMDGHQLTVEAAIAAEVTPRSSLAGVSSSTRGNKALPPLVSASKTLVLPDVPADRERELLKDRELTAGEKLGIAADELVLTFFLDEQFVGDQVEKRMTVWVITGGHPIFTIRYRMPANSIKKVQDDLIRGLTDGRPNTQRLAYFHDIFIAPLLDGLAKQRITDLQKYKVVLIPFGLLNTLPVHAFYDNDSDRYFFQHFKGMVYSPSFELYVKGKYKKLARPYSLLAVAITEFESLSNLNATLEEARSILPLVQGRKKLLADEQAVKANVLAEIPAADIVHFATHGKFDSKRPNASTIYLHGDAKPGANLKAYEFAHMDLSNKMFVLSACETGQQDMAPGDDLFGIERYLLAGGAVAVLSSLWQVDDQATSSFMLDFYKQLSAGSTPSEAWFQALVRALESNPGPHLWAPFKITAFQ